MGGDSAAPHLRLDQHLCVFRLSAPCPQRLSFFVLTMHLASCPQGLLFSLGFLRLHPAQLAGTGPLRPGTGAALTVSETASEWLFALLYPELEGGGPQPDQWPPRGMGGHALLPLGVIGAPSLVGRVWCKPLLSKQPGPSSLKVGSLPLAGDH